MTGSQMFRPTSFLTRFEPFVLKGLIISLFFHLVAAYFSVGYQSHDEHFRVMEFVALKTGLTSKNEMTDEFHDRTASWLQPAVYTVVSHVLSAVGITSPFVWAFVFRLISTILGWASVLTLVILSRSWFPQFQKEAIWLLCFTWFLPYIHARPSPENWGGSFFILGFGLALLKADGSKRVWINALIGVLWGLSFNSRYQTGILILFFGVWLLIKRRLTLKDVASMSLGFIGVSLLTELLNRWGYECWSFPAWNYFFETIIKGRVSHGESSGALYYLIQVISKSGVPFALTLPLGVFAWILYPLHALTWITAPFFLIHQWMAHKQTNYLFPIATPALLLILLLMNRYSLEKIQKYWAIKTGLGLAGVINAILLVFFSCTPADTKTAFFEHVAGLPAPVEIYSLIGNPYQVVGLPMNFYKPSHVKLNLVAEGQGLSHTIERVFTTPGNGVARDGFIWIAAPNFRVPASSPSLPLSCERTYSNFPPFVERFNWGHWIERSGVWSLHRCKRI